MARMREVKAALRAEMAQLEAQRAGLESKIDGIMKTLAMLDAPASKPRKPRTPKAPATMVVNATSGVLPTDIK